MNSNYGWQKFAAQNKQQQLRREAVIQRQLREGVETDPAEKGTIPNQIRYAIFIFAGYFLQ